MIELEDHGAWPELRRRIDRQHARLKDFRHLHGLLGQALADWVTRNFAAEGRLGEDTPGGWPNLAPATLAARRRKGQGRRILQATGRLRRGILTRADRRKAVTGTRIPYAARHQFGLGVPRRPFLPSARQTMKVARPVVERFIQGASA